MSDITTKLRQGQCSFELNGDAASEIDRLREENARLREALEKIAAGGSTMRGGSAWAVRIARAAIDD